MILTRQSVDIETQIMLHNSTALKECKKIEAKK